jgi:hypothetical protein
MASPDKIAEAFEIGDDDFRLDDEVIDEPTKRGSGFPLPHYLCDFRHGSNGPVAG